MHARAGLSGAKKQIYHSRAGISDNRRDIDSVRQNIKRRSWGGGGVAKQLEEEAERVSRSKQLKQRVLYETC